MRFPEDSPKDPEGVGRSSAEPRSMLDDPFDLELVKSRPLIGRIGMEGLAGTPADTISSTPPACTRLGNTSRVAPSVGWSVLAQVPLIGRAFVMALLPTRLGPLQSKWWTLASLAVVCQFARTEGTTYYNVADMISQESEGATALLYYPDDGYGYTGKCRIVRQTAKP